MHFQSPFDQPEYRRQARNPHVDDSWVLERYADGTFGAYPFSFGTPMVAKSRKRIVFGSTVKAVVRKLEKQEGRKLKPWTYREREALEKRNPPTAKAKAKAKAKKRNHVKDKAFEALRKQISPALKAAEKLLTKRNADRMQKVADGILKRATAKHGSGSMFAQSARLYYAPLVRSLKAGFAEAKRAAATLRSTATRQGDYNRAKAAYVGAAWGVAENMLRASDLLVNTEKPFTKESEAFSDAWFELTNAIKPIRLLSANPGISSRAHKGDILARERFLEKIRRA